MSQSEADDELMHRRLCPDGGCIGVVGPDGRCKECGQVDESVITDPRLRGLKTPAVGDSKENDIDDEFDNHDDDGDEDEDDDDDGADAFDEFDDGDEDSEDDDDGDGDQESDDDEDSDSEVESEKAEGNRESTGGDSMSESDFAERRLCPDGACLGVIGPDGSCKECGTVL